MSRNSRPPRQSFGLSLERLEARDVPAAYYWAPPLGSDLSAATASNWRIGSGPSLLASQPPDADDHLYFVGGLGQMDCLIPATLTASSGNAFAGIHLLFGPGPTTATGDGESGGGLPGLVGYWNTVTLADSFSVGALTVECGYISQGSSSVPSGNGSTLTVTSSLNWTGGTLNSNSVAGFINLAPGATGVAEPSFTNPGINGTVYLGSVLTTQASSTLTVKAGTYNMTVSCGFNVLASSLLNLAPGAPVPKRPEEPPPLDGEFSIKFDNGQAATYATTQSTTIKVFSDATMTIQPALGGKGVYSQVEFTGQDCGIENRGTVVIRDKTQVKFNQDAGGTGAYQQVDESALTRVEAGCGFIGKDEQDSKVLIEKGVFEMTELSGGNGQPLATQPNVFIGRAINGTAYPSGFYLGPFALLRHADATVPMILDVRGTFKFRGTVELFADTTANKNDQIIVSGQVKVVGGTVAMRWFNPNSSPLGQEWNLITSDYTGGAGDPITAEPEFSDPDPTSVPPLHASLFDTKVFRVLRGD